MELKDFPLVMRAFKEIELDNGGTRARKLKQETKIPEYWLIPFQVAEVVLGQCGDKTTEEIPALAAMEEFEPPAPLWEAVSLSVNESDQAVYRYLEVGQLQGWVTTQLLNQFFDGELSQMFTEKRRPL